jgi:uncharacterized RDD family membrane protein YckC
VAGPERARSTLTGVSDSGALPYETASWGRRILALLVDWFASTLVVIVFVGFDAYSETGSSAQLWVLPTFVVETAVLTATVGGSFGKMVTRLRVVRVADGGRVDLIRSFARSVLIALVIPPLVFRPDGRGLHDVVAGSATVTLEVSTRSR